MTYKNLGSHIDVKTGYRVCDIMVNEDKNAEKRYALRDYAKMTIKEYKTFKRLCRESLIVVHRYCVMTGGTTIYRLAK